VQQERGFVLHMLLGNWEVAQQLTDRISIILSLDISNAIAHDTGV